MAEPTTEAPAQDETVTTAKVENTDETGNTEQDGGKADAQSERFEDHKWESDEEWLLLLRGLDFGVLPEDKKMKYIEKRKHKYFKEKIDPTHEIPKVESRSRGSRYQAPPSAAEDASGAGASSGGAGGDDDVSTEEKKPSEPESNAKSDTRSRASEGSQASQGSQRTQSTGSRSSYRAHSQPRQLSAIDEALNYFFVLSQWFIFINCVLSLVMTSAHYRALYGVVASHIAALFQNVGRPQFNMYYAQRLFQDENIMIVLYAVLFLMGPAVFVFLVPIAMRSLLMGSYMLSSLAANKMPSMYAKIHPLLKRVTSKYYWFETNIALAEVLIGIFLIPACLFLNRTLLLTLFYWQVMHGRYMMSQPLKHAFYVVNQKLESLFTPVPAVLNIYKKIAQFLYDKVDPEKLQQQMREQQSGGGGGIGSMLKSCNIM